MNGLMYRDHDVSHKRVWRDDWAGDCFEIITNTDFVTLENMCKRLSIPLIEAEDD